VPRYYGDWLDILVVATAIVCTVILVIAEIVRLAT
jgi:hypothetical protein